MTRRDFYVLVGESGVNPLTLRGFLLGNRKTQPATVKLITDTAKQLGLELTAPAEEASGDA